MKLSARSTFDERHGALLHALRALPDPQARLSWVVDRASRLPPLAPSLRTPETEVKGCSARLWLHAEVAHGRCHFRADSESAILKSLSSLLCELYDGLTPAEVAAHEPTLLETTGLLRSLTDRRRETIHRFREALRTFASAQHRGAMPAR